MISKNRGHQEISGEKLVPRKLASMPKPENCNRYTGKISKIKNLIVNLVQSKIRLNVTMNHSKSKCSTWNKLQC